MIFRAILFITLCMQTNLVLTMIEEISKTGGTPADLLGSLKNESGKGKEHTEKEGDKDVRLEKTLDELELALMQLKEQREADKTETQKMVSPKLPLYFKNIANDFDVKKYPGIEIITLMSDDTKQINKALESLLINIQDYWMTDSEQKVASAVIALSGLSELLVEKEWCPRYPKILGSAKAACCDAKLMRSGILKFDCNCKTCIKCKPRCHDTYAILRAAYFNLECVEKIDKYITERRQKPHG